EEAIRKIEGEAANPPVPPAPRPVTPPSPASPPPSVRAPVGPPRDRAAGAGGANNVRGADELELPADRDPFEPDAPPPGRGDDPRMPREPREPRAGNGRERPPRARGPQEPGHTQ